MGNIYGKLSSGSSQSVLYTLWKAVSERAHSVCFLKVDTLVGELSRKYEITALPVTQSDPRSLPDVEGNRHHGVENNEVGPEYEGGRDK